MPSSTVILFEDETIVRLFPGLKKGWSIAGEQAKVPISGMNARRVLFGTINIRTGHRISKEYKTMKAAFFQAFLLEVRRRYKGRPICMLLDGASSHKTVAVRRTAALLNIDLIWLPKQCPELNAMDHLWRSLKQTISANHQYDSIDEHVQMAIDYTLGLSNYEARTKAGILSQNFWLKRFLS